MTGARAWAFILPLMLAEPAFAGRWNNQCQQSSQTQAQQCQDAAQQALQTDANNRAQGSIQSDNSIRNNAPNLKGKIDSNRAALQKAISQCNQNKSQCDQDCANAKQGAQAGLANESTRQEAQQDLGDIPNTQQNKCDGPIDKNLQQLNQGLSNLPSQSDQAGQTGQQANGNQSPSNKPSDSTADAGSAAAAATPGSLDCTQASGSRFSDCNSSFVTKCTASMGATGCDGFTNRYCNMTSSSTTAQASLPAATTNLVIDKTGEGVGSQYCSYANAYRYCQTPGRESCPSCLRVYAQSNCTGGVACLAQSSAPVSQQALAACPDDPSYLGGGAAASSAVGAGSATVSGANASSSDAIASGTTTYAATGSSSAPNGLIATAADAGGSSSGGSSGGSVGGGSSSTSGAAAAGTGAANREGQGAGVIGDSGAMGGGGGGGGAWVTGRERDLASIDPKLAFEAKKDQKAEPLEGAARDVANPIGPSVFSIGSNALHEYCTRVKIPACVSGR